MTTSASLGLDGLAERLMARLPSGAVITDRVQLRTFECDGLAHYRAVPGLVVLATSAADVAATVSECAAAGVPFVARGSGTGLSGGALPRADGVLIVTSKLRTVHEVDIANQRAVVDPGVINLEVTRAAAPWGYHYAPDPSSQQVCSIGGNVAENSG
ncbi:MAG TPA: FAD-binding protein, partial [Acidimicrobiales bacterium]|nr:FAD-binding protein [Acidimicrobiales bacterium]